METPLGRKRDVVGALGMNFKEMIRSFVEERGVLGALRFRIMYKRHQG